MGSYRLVIVGLVAIVMGALSPSGRVTAQVQTIDFAVPTDTTVGSGSGDEVLVFTGRPLGTTDPGNCSAASLHVQNAVYIEPGKHQPALLTVLVLRPSDDPVPPGTKLVNLQTLSTCTISGVEYTKYRGEVQ